jgi:hypothetical protein
VSCYFCPGYPKQSYSKVFTASNLLSVFIILFFIEASQNPIVFIFVFQIMESYVPAKPLRDAHPEIEPFDSGHLKVSELHSVYYEQNGNKEGKPVLFL